MLFLRVSWKMLDDGRMEMFAVGKTYEVTLLETGDNDEGKWCTYETRQQYDCISVEGTLIGFRTPKISDEDKELFGDEGFSEEIFLNTNSQFFHRAKLVDG
jgi:hypothetical protein